MGKTCDVITKYTQDCKSRVNKNSKKNKQTGRVAKNDEKNKGIEPILISIKLYCILVKQSEVLIIFSSFAI